MEIILLPITANLHKNGRRWFTLIQLYLLNLVLYDNGAAINAISAQISKTLAVIVMTRKLFTLLIIITIFCSCNRQKVSVLTEDEVYSIINQIIKDDNLPILNVCSRFHQIPIKGDYLSEFTDQDLNFIIESKKSFSGIKIRPNQLKWFNKSENTQKFVSVDTVCNEGTNYNISFPLISSDRRKVLIEFEKDCNCPFGGQGGKTLYIKKNGKWVNTKSFDHWISFNFGKKNNYS